MAAIRSSPTAFCPRSIIAANPEWLRPLVGVQPAGGNFLHFVAFDIGRGPGGQWWVLEDRVQAPSGAGFALENRVATARVFSDYYADAHVHRLAGFFRQFRDALNAIRGSEDNGLGILSPGPMTDTYYEHAYIARYLGLPLLEGEDLTVESGRVMVRSVSGNLPGQRALAAARFELRRPAGTGRRLAAGHAGLLEAVRQGNLAFVNALGTGALEAKALFAFLPGICRALRGEPLAMPNVATWWCGHQAERDFVAENAGKMVIRPAMPEWRSADGRTPRNFGIDLSAQGVTLSARNGRHFVGQEAVTLSTTPAWENGRLVPRPLSLRVYLARTPDGWTAMPGGFARIGQYERPQGRGHAERRIGRRCLGGVGPAGQGRDDAASAVGALCCGRARARCPAARRTICSGSDATSNAPKARCVCCAPISYGSAEAGETETRCWPTCAPISKIWRSTPDEAVPADAARHVLVRHRQRRQGARPLLGRWLDGAERSRRQRRQDRAHIDAWATTAPAP